jgi:hypothetical protein
VRGDRHPGVARLDHAFVAGHHAGAVEDLDPILGFAYLELPADAWRLAGTDTLAVGEPGVALLDRLGRRALAERWELSRTVAVPDSFADSTLEWVRANGTTTLRDGFAQPWLAPWAAVERIGARTLRVHGSLFRIVDARLADSTVAPVDSAERWIPQSPERAAFALTLLGRRAPAPAAAPDAGAAAVSAPAMAFGGPRHIGRSPFPAPAREPAVAWVHRTAGRIASPIVSFGDTLVVTSFDGTVRALGVDGALRWQVRLPQRIFGSAAVGGDGTVFVGCDDDRVRAIAPGGRIVWEQATTADADTSPTIGPSVVSRVWKLGNVDSTPPIWKRSSRARHAPCSKAAPTASSSRP